MKTKFSFVDPGLIMGVVVSLIILAVGTFAFFVTLKNLPQQSGTVQYQAQYDAINNTSTTGNNVFNIVGVVLIIGAIMAIVGFVYQYVR